jgi:hypothetical protein
VILKSALSMASDNADARATLKGVQAMRVAVADLPGPLELTGGFKSLLRAGGESKLQEAEIRVDGDRTYLFVRVAVR